MNHLEEVNTWIERNREQILETISALVRIPTENLPPGGNEKPGQEYLHDWASRQVASAELDLFEVDEVPGVREHPLFFPTIDGAERLYRDRPILVARRRGAGGGRSLALSGHLDTVPTFGKRWETFPDPYSGAIKDGWMYGRGTMDMKAGTAAGFLALKCLHDLKIRLKGDVYAESVVDEENGGVNGTIAARLRNPDIDFAILSEPSSLDVGIESLGGSDWKVTVTEAGFGGIPTDVELPNPVYKLGRVALALEKYDRRLAEMRVPETYGPGTRLRLLTYQIHCGGSSYQDAGAVPTGGHIFFWQEAFAYVGEAEARRDLLEFLQAELGADPHFRSGLPRVETVIRFLEGHRTDRAHQALSVIRRVYEALGLPHRQRGVPFATDAFAFRRVTGTDVVIIGPAGRNLHGVDECVEVQSVLDLIRLMVLTAIEYCG